MMVLTRPKKKKEWIKAEPEKRKDGFKPKYIKKERF